MGKPNYKQIFAIQKNNEETIVKHCPEARHTSGIYAFYRRDENDFKYAYIGQATKSLISRLAQHLSGYSQWVDCSIKKHKLYNEQTNPYGYKIAILCFCRPEECDEKEKEYIKKCADEGWQLRNVTGGSQGVGKSDINDRKPAKTYMDGVKQGKETIRKELKVISDKYLTIGVIKDNKLSHRMLDKFNNILRGDENGDSSNE